MILIPLGVFISWMGDDDVPSTQVGMHDSNTIARNLAQAKLRAEEEEVARLTKAVSSQLPTAITVPHCDQGMSAPVVIPAGWHLRSGWGGASIKVEYLNNGDWKVATQTNIREAVEAFRYCTPSKSNASIGRMPLTWKRS
ncbi:MAG TPA: hypothetical protein PKD95_00910 [Candidatus Paceibacterota bacterium]|nr:hypothetical protein [Candidatus Paceibacterota bacterium]